MFNTNCKTAILSGKQYTKAYCKAHSITEALPWATLSRVQRKVFNMVDASFGLMQADPSLTLFSSHCGELRAELEKYARILNGTDAETVSNLCMTALVIGARSFKAKDGVLSDDLKGGFGKWLQLCLYRDSCKTEVTQEQAEVAFAEAGKDPVKAKKSRSNSKVSKKRLDITDDMRALFARYSHGDCDAKAQVDALLAALAAD